MKRKSILTMIIAFVMLLSSVTPVFAERPIKVMVGGEILETDVAPEIVEGRILLPLRAVFEAIGAEVLWDGETKTVTAKRKDDAVSFTIGVNVMKVNGSDKAIDVPAMIKSGRTLVPLRACAEAFELDVNWSAKTRTAKVKVPVMVVSEEMSQFSNKVTKYTYDDAGNVATSVYDNQAPTYYVYDEEGLLIRTHKIDDAGNAINITDYKYNEYGELVDQTSDSGGGYVYEYDNNGNCIYKASKDSDFWERKTYNENNQITYEENNKGEWEKSTYYDNGLLATTSSCGLSRYMETFLVVRTDVQRTYNAEGKLLTYMSQKQVTTLDGRMVSDIPDTNVERYYTYDNRGNLTGTYGSEGVTEYRYDENNLKVYEKNYNGSEIYYTYYESGLLESRESINGNTITEDVYDYDEYGNVITHANISYKEGKTPEDYTVIRENYTDYEYEYDDNGNILCKRVFGNNESSEYVYEYDDEGNLIYEKDANGVWVKYIKVVK